MTRHVQKMIQEQTAIETIDGVNLHTLWHGEEAIGYIAIDSTINGQSSGGLRMLPDIDGDEMIGLARAMTLKYGFLGLPQGGAKAGVRGNPEAPKKERWEQLVQFGTGVKSLLKSGTYSPYPDMGTCAEDITNMLMECGIHPGRRAIEDHDSGYYTAATVCATAVVASRRLGLNPGESCAAIEGFGKVGSSLAALLKAAGFKIVAVSTRLGGIYDPAGLDVGQLIEMHNKSGSRVVEEYRNAEKVSLKDLLELPVELLCPCARHNTISEDNASKLNCRIVCAGANNPATSRAEGLLAARRILMIPDFVSNCGGVLGGTMEFAGIPHERILELLQQCMEISVASLLEKAEKTGESLRIIAEAAARKRFESVKRAAESPSITGHLLTAGLSAYRNGLIPSGVVGLVAPAYFKKLPVFHPVD